MTKIVVKNTYGYKAYKAQREFWDLRNVPPALDYTEPFYVENITNDDETLSIAKLSEVTTGTDICQDITVEYSYDKSVWDTLGTTTHDGAPLTLELNPGDKVYLRASTLRWGPSTNVKIYNNIRGVSKIGGNVMSLLYGSNFTGQEKTFRDTVGFDFYRTFIGNANLIDAGKLILPATTLYNRSYASILSNCPNLMTTPTVMDFVNLGEASCGWMFENDTSLTKAPKLLPTTLTNSCYYGMFKGCSSLTTAPALPATTLATNCYREMFYDCSSLTTAPTLPATTLATNCYREMFYGCSSLTTAPTLPATTLTNSCYYGMFKGCSSLTTAPALPATTLASYCYYSMFQGCTSLTTAPTLPATTLATNCYREMFYGCSSLTTAPTLPATTLVQNCYYSMFQGCTSLTTAPTLPATTLASYCYYSMFQGCTSLTTAPTLPATTLASYCYDGMFQGCTSLTTAPTLPATTLASYCYYMMFQNCSSLTTAPTLPAITLKSNCYGRMFYRCTNLNEIRAMFTSTPGSNTNNWVWGVAATGTFYKNKDATWTNTGTSAVPSGWTIITV